MTLTIRSKTTIRSRTSVISSPAASTSNLLDLYPAKFAYSFRKLKSTATQSLRVNRSSDSTEQDIGFDVSGNFDLTSYSNFVGGGIGRITRWYDQTGNGNHFNSNGVVAEMPIFASASFGVKPGMRFDGVNDAMSSVNNPYISATAATVFEITKIPVDPNPTASTTGAFFFATGDPTNGSHFPWTDGVIYDTLFTTSRKTTGNPTASFTNPNLYTVLSGANDWRSYVNNINHFSTSTNTFGGASASGVAWLGISFVGFYWFPGWASELIVYDQLLNDTDRTSISDNINNYFSLY